MQGVAIWNVTKSYLGRGMLKNDKLSILYIDIIVNINVIASNSNIT